MRRMIHLMGVWTVAALLLCVASASACPNCKEAYMPETGASVAAGYSTSILLMMATPFVVLGVIGVRIWISARRQRISPDAVTDAASQSDALQNS